MALNMYIVYYILVVIYKISVLEYKQEKGLHPTQKPVKLCEYLIKTYTNEGEIVLDNCIKCQDIIFAISQLCIGQRCCASSEEIVIEIACFLF